MGDQHRLSRIDTALSQLFESLLPDPSAVNDAQTLNWLRSVVKRAETSIHASQDDPPPDVNSAHDLIKRKLLRENASPEKAASFSNLYSRLLSMPVLNQKWRILYLLYSLSNERLNTSHNTRSPLAEYEHRALGEENLHFHTRRESDEDSDRQVEKRHSVDPKVFTISPKKVQIPAKDARTAQKVFKPQSPAANQRPQQEPIRDVPSELDLLRDLPFNMQGLSSKTYQFVSPGTARLPANLPVPILSLLNTLAEPCLLYKKLADFVGAQDGGLVHQSLRSAIGTELRSYLGLVATLETEIRRALTAIEVGDDDRKGVRAAGVTLKRAVIWTYDATMGLRLMTLIVEEAQSKRGGQIITLIHNLLSSHGDPFVAAYAERLLLIVARPFYDMLRHWIYDGELVDPYLEFFVVENDPSYKADIDPRREVTSVWKDKYKLDDALVPSIISDDLARKIFLIGKSLNFIRHNCGDSDWVIQYSQSNSKSLDYASTSHAALSDNIDTAYTTTMSRLTHLMSHKFLLNTHLHALKKYLFLSQGDFIDLLVEFLAPNLDRPAHSQYRHNLTSQLEHAVRHSNAQYDDPEVLRRLDARMIELNKNDTGWDCFTLEYKISAPCDVVITQWANTQYLKIFNVLLRVKRVEYSLNTTYRRCMTGARGVLSSAAVNDKLNTDWQTARCLIAEMVHFVNQLQYYILFEVVEASWETLQRTISRPDATLDDLIEAHTKYVNTIVQKGLLASSAEREDGFLVQLHNMLKCMLNYRDAIESLYSYSVSEYTKRAQFAARIDKRTAAGKWGITEKDLKDSSSRSSTPAGTSRHDRWSNLSEDNTASPVLLPSHAGDDASLLMTLRKRMSDLRTEWGTRVNAFLYDLAHQPDVDLRFLGVVMNFNERYKPVNPKRQRRKARDAADRRSGDVPGASSVLAHHERAESREQT